MEQTVMLNFIKSRGWKIVCEEIDSRISDIEEVILTPISDIDKLTSEKMTPQEKVNFIESKQKERENLIFLKSIPQEIIDSQVLSTD